MIDKNIFNSDAPNVLAASSNFMSCASINTLIGLTIKGKDIMEHANAAPIHEKDKLILKFSKRKFPKKLFFPNIINNI